ncbi:MAG: potassium channel family protein [Saprospiraceae bacterium]|nr:potassium channel family protein [Saprospiraceae bacterium]
MKRKVIALVLLVFTFTFLQAKAEIPILDKDDIVKLWSQDIHYRNIDLQKQGIDTLSYSKENITDSLMCDYITERLLNKEIDFSKYPEIFKRSSIIARNKFIYKDIFVFEGNNMKHGSFTDSLNMNDILDINNITDINYFYISHLNKFEIVISSLYSLGGVWRFSSIDTLKYQLMNKRTYDFLDENYPERISYYNNEKCINLFPDINIIINNIDHILPVDFINSYLNFDFSKIRRIRFVADEDDSILSIDKIFHNVSYKIYDCRLDVVQGDFNEFIADDCSFSELELNIDNNLSITNCTISKSIILNKIPHKLSFTSSSINSNFILPDLDSSDQSKLIFEDNQFKEGFDFDWNILKQVKLDVTDGPNRAERMQRMYSMLKSNLKRMNMLEDADDCHYVSRDYLRKNYWKDSDANIFTRAFKALFYFVDWISTGYGTKPLRIFPYALCVIILFAIIYYMNPESINNLHEHIEFKNILTNKLSKLTYESLKEKFSHVLGEEKADDKVKLIEQIMQSLDSKEIVKLSGVSIIRSKLTQFWNCFYFSFSTFTTIGVGDWYPRNSFTKLLVMMEGALGWISLGLFITSYGNLLLR